MSVCFGSVLLQDGAVLVLLFVLLDRTPAMGIYSFQTPLALSEGHSGTKLMLRVPLAFAKDRRPSMGLTGTYAHSGLTQIDFWTVTLNS